MSNIKTRIESVKLYPELKECVLCKSKKNLVRHHLDYYNPQLIMIMCRKCHANWHKNSKALNRDDEKYLMLKFSGNKEELHQQLKVWCAESKKTMNGTIIELIQLLVKAGSIEKINN